MYRASVLQYVAVKRAAPLSGALDDFSLSMKNLSILIALDEKALDEWMKNRAAPRKMKKILGNLARRAMCRMCSR